MATTARWSRRVPPAAIDSARSPTPSRPAASLRSGQIPGRSSTELPHRGRPSRAARSRPSERRRPRLPSFQSPATKVCGVVRSGLGQRHRIPVDGPDQCIQVRRAGRQQPPALLRPPRSAPARRARSSSGAITPGAKRSRTGAPGTHSPRSSRQPRNRVCMAAMWSRKPSCCRSPIGVSPAGTRSAARSCHQDRQPGRRGRSPPAPCRRSRGRSPAARRGSRPA